MIIMIITWLIMMIMINTNLGEELKDDGVVVPMVDFVPHAQEDAEGHVDHTEDQRDLHLVSIQKRYRV